MSSPLHTALDANTYLNFHPNLQNIRETASDMYTKELQRRLQHMLYEIDGLCFKMHEMAVDVASMNVSSQSDKQADQEKESRMFRKKVDAMTDRLENLKKERDIYVCISRMRGLV